MATLALLFQALSQRGDAPGLRAFGRGEATALTAAELTGRIERVAAALAERHGAGPGVHVALLAGAGATAVIAALAVIRSGATLVPLDTQLADDDLGPVVADADPALFIVADDQLEHVRRLGGGRPQIAIEALPEAEARPLPEPAESDIAALFYTSGTTGAPKGVPLSHANLAYQIEVVRAANIVHAGERVLLPLPLHHVYPFAVGLLALLAIGLCIVLPRALTGPEVLRAIREGRVNAIVGVPRLYRALVEGLDSRLARSGRTAAAVLHAGEALARGLRPLGIRRAGRLLLRPLHRRLGPQLRLLASGGAALDPALAVRLETLGWQLAQGYGLTETSPLLTINPPGSPHPESIGRAVPGTELRTRDDELQARGPGVFAGYRHLDDATASVFTGDGWFRTGDLGRIEADGYVYVTGRASTLIVTEGGKNVQPDGVEAAYEKHPDVAEIGVLARRGALVAVAVPSPGDDSEARLRRAIGEVAANLPSYQRLADVAVTLQPLPRTRLGKLRRHLLESRFEEARRGDRGPPPGPMPLEEMADPDRELLADDNARQVWDWLTQRYPDRRLTPDSRPDMELGIDSMGWLDVSIEIGARTGVELDETQIARIETVRDLLQVVTEADGRDTGSPLDEPERVLSPRDRRWLQPLAPFPAAVARSLLGLDRRLVRRWLRLTIQGETRFPEQCLFAPNHVSYLDPFVVAAGLDDKRMARTFWAGWTGAAFRNPVTRAVSRLAQAVPIDQRNVRTSLALAAATLKNGHSLVWFPEGSRSENGTLQPFKAGLGRLLARYPVPVVPVLIHGTYESLPPHRLWPRRRPVVVEFGPALSTDELERLGDGETRADRLTSGLRRWMLDHLAA